MSRPTSRELIETAEAYFARVDAADVPRVMALLTPDCTLEVVTHPIAHVGGAAIEAMFKRRLTKRARHDNF